MIRSFLHRLWYASRETWAENQNPVAVDWPSGPLRARVTTKVGVHLMIWLADGRVLGVGADQPVEILLETDLEVPARAMMVLKLDPHPLVIEDLQVRELPMLAAPPMALDVLQGGGWALLHTPRWRLLLRGIRAAFRWAPVAEERK